MTAALTLLACGNPSRGDDAVAPLLFAWLQERHGQRANLRWVLDFQWQIEHVEDLRDCRAALFLDADAAIATPWQITPAYPAADFAHTTHALPPSALLHVYRQVYRAEPPPAYVLHIHGTCFDLGAPLSPATASALAQLQPLLDTWLAQEAPQLSLLLAKQT